MRRIGFKMIALACTQFAVLQVPPIPVYFIQIGAKLVYGLPEIIHRGSLYYSFKGYAMA